jgi:hypothetical protein
VHRFAKHPMGLLRGRMPNAALVMVAV